MPTMISISMMMRNVRKSPFASALSFENQTPIPAFFLSTNGTSASPAMMSVGIITPPITAE